MSNVKYFLSQYIKDVILFILLFISLIVNLYVLFNNNTNKNLSNEIAILPEVEKDITEDNNKTINIDIKGAVKKPGVYSVSDGTIINDIILMAGGFNANAYKDGINLSKKVTDEMVIYVYTKSQINSNTSLKQTLQVDDKNNNFDYYIKEYIDNKESIIDSNNINVNNFDTNQNLVNINIAQKEELTTLSGIGDAKAQAIIDYRKENGNFKSINDLTNVTGIGEALFAKIKNYITV